MADIDLTRPILKNPDGTFSTEESITVDADGRWFNIPTIVGGKRLSDDDAKAAWMAGKNPHVGVFQSKDEAVNAAVARSQEIGRVRSKEMADDKMPDPFQAQSLFSDPEFLQGAAMIAAKNRDPMAMKWLEQAHVAAKEGAFEAVGHLMAGNPQEAVNVWNRTGQFRDVTNVNQNKDGTYTVTRKGGQSMTIDPQKEYMRMLSPREYITHQENQKLRDERASERKIVQDRLAAQDAETRRHNMAMEGIAGANSAISAYRAAGYGGGGTRSSSGSSSGGGGSPDPLKPTDTIKLWNDISKQVTDEQQKTNMDAAAKLPDVNAETWRRFVQQTAIMDDKVRSDGRWVIKIPHQSGQYSEYRAYEDKREALEAFRNLKEHGVLPGKQGALMRDDTRAPGEGGPSIGITYGSTGVEREGIMPPSGSAVSGAPREARMPLRRPIVDEAPPVAAPAGNGPREARVPLRRPTAPAPAVAPAVAPAPPAASPPRNPSVAIPPGNAGIPADQQFGAMARPGYFRLYEDTPDRLRQQIAEITSIIGDVQKGRRRLPAGEVKRLHDELRAAQARLKAMGAE